MGDSEAADGVLGNLPSTVTQETSTFEEAANADDYGTSWNYGSQRNAINGELLACYALYKIVCQDL